MKQIFGVLFSFAFVLLNGQTTSLGFNEVYAQKLQNKLQQVNTQKGISAAVIIPGQGIWVGTDGETDGNEPITPAMRFGIASNSKAITAGLILRLQDEGLLDIDDAISEHLPSIPNVNGSITIRQLLTHTTGLFDFINDWSTTTQNEYVTSPNKTWTFDDLVETLGFAHDPPGIKYDYSNTNFLIAGMIAEAVTGESINALLHSRIFDPLDLDMAYPVGDDIFDQPYANLWNGSNFTLNEGSSKGFLTYPSTAGAVWSTAYDMVRWYDGLFSKIWLSPESQYDLRDNDGHIAYALGLRLRNVYGNSFYYHAGAWGYRSYMLHDPNSGISLCILSNDRVGGSMSSIAFDLFEEVMDELPKKAYDVAIRKVLPMGNICSLNEALKIVLENKGTSALNEISAVYSIDENWTGTSTVQLDVPLEPGTIDTVYFGLTADITDQNKHTINVELELVQADAYLWNNGGVMEFVLNEGEGIELPFLEDFESTEDFPEDLISLESQHILGWKRTEFVSLSGDQSLARNNYVDQNFIETYEFELPKINLVEAAELTFNYAHANVNSGQKDDLYVQVSTDCGANFTNVLSLINNGFTTAPTTSEIFQPMNNQWEEGFVDLSEYTGQEVIIRFSLHNDYGNVAYLDDIEVDYFVVSTDEVNNTSIKLFPNPAKDEFTIELEPGKVNRISVINSFGEIIQSHAVNESQSMLTIRRNQLPAGMYLIRFEKDKTLIGNKKMIFLN